MSELTLILNLGTMIIAAAVVVALLRRISIPNLVSYIIAGLVLLPINRLIEWALPGRFLEYDLTELTIIKTISEVGIALLLFLVGLELSLKKIRDVGKVALVAGIGQVVFTAAGGFVIAVVLGFNPVESIFLAVALTFSSTVVVVKLLDQKRELDSLYGRIAVGIFLVQDLVVILFLTILAGLETAGDVVEWGGIARNITKAFLGMGLLFLIALASSRYILPRAFRWASIRSSEMLFIWAVCWCFLFVIMAEALGLSIEIGAFLAGLSIAQLDDGSEDLHRRLRPLVNFFIAVFFISLGAQMEFSAARDNYFAAAVLSLFVLIGNPLIFIVIIARMGYSPKTAFLTSVTVAQISEFSFIFGALGLATGLIGGSILSLITLVGLVTIAISSYMILYNHQLYEKLHGFGLFRLLERRRAAAQEPSAAAERLRGHIIVIGLNSMGRRLVAELHARGEEVLAIDTDPVKLQGLPVRTILGDVSNLALLEEAGYEEAKLIISALHIEEVNLLLAYRCAKLGVRAAIHAFDSSVIADLRRLGVARLIDSKGLSVQALRDVIYDEEAADA